MRRLLLALFCVALPNAALAQQIDGEPIFVLNTGGHTSTVNMLLFTPDGKELISVSDDKTIRTWDAATGEALRVLRPPIGSDHVGKLFAAALSPDGKTLAVAGVGGGSGGDNPVYLIAYETGAIERVLTGHDDEIWTVAFSPDGKLLAPGSLDKTARLWNVVTGACQQTLKEHTGLVYGAEFSPDGQQLVSVSKDGTGCIWSVKTGQRVAVLKGHQKEILCVAWSPDGKTISSGSADNSVRLWDAKGNPLKPFPNLGNSIQSVAYTANSKQLLITRGGGTGSHVCSFLDLETGKEPVQFKGHDDDVEDGVLSPDGALAATSGGRNQATWIWRTADAAVVAKLVSQGKGVYSAGWSKDGAAIAWGNTPSEGAADSTAPLERSFSLAELEQGPAPDKTFRRAQLGGGSLSLEKVDDLTIAVKQDGKKTAELKLTGTAEKVRCFTLMPDDMAAVGSNLALYWFSTRTGKQLRVCKWHVDEIFAMAPSPDNRYLLTASGDQTLCVWTPDRRRPLVSLFFTDSEWVAWTPEGYYADSPGGASLMGWHINHGREKMASFHSAAEFKESLYRPDVIKLLLKTGSVKRALAEADKARGKATELESVAKVLPPSVEITSPDKPDIETAEPTAVVRFFAMHSGSQPITSARLMVNGRPYSGADGVKTFNPPRDGAVRESWTVHLAPGANTFVVLAESAVSKGASEPVTVTLVKARGLEQIGPTAEEQKAQLPSLYVLAVGVSDYPGKLKLNYAANDAESLASALEKNSKGLYNKVEVDVLTDKKATRKGILKGLTWMRKKMTNNDVGVLFFAGHGGKDSDGSFYLFPVDVDPDDLLATGVPGDQVKKTLAGIPGKFLVMLDACHSGAVGGERRRAGGSLTDELVRDLANDDFGILVMCSSMGREFSLESAKVGHGFFTLAIVEGLEGKAEKSKEGAVFTCNLYAYVTERVKELSKGEQHPVALMPGTMRSFPLTKP